MNNGARRSLSLVPQVCMLSVVTYSHISRKLFIFKPCVEWCFLTIDNHEVGRSTEQEGTSITSTPCTEMTRVQRYVFTTGSLYLRMWAILRTVAIAQPSQQAS